MQNIEDLKKKNKILKEILNTSWDGIAIVTLDGKFSFINDAFMPMFAYNKKELFDLTFFDLLENNSKQNLQKALGTDISKLINTKLTLKAIRKDKKIIYIRMSAQLMSNKKLYLLNITDITELETKHLQTDKFIITIELDKKHNIVCASEAFYKMSSLDKADIINKHYTTILASTTLPYHKNSLQKHLDESLNWEGKLVIKKKDNSNFNVDAICNIVLNKYSDVTAYSIAMVNTSSITSDKEETLEKMLIDEEEKLAIMTETMRTVAHEWRQPLNSISLGAQELIFELDFDDEINKDSVISKLEDISKSTQKLSNIIESFQNITNIEGSKKKRNVKEIVNEALKISNLYGNYIHTKDEDTKAFRTYPKELASAFSSILINANEVLEGKEDKRIDILTYDDGKNIICEISNNGGHIPDDIINKIFTPYFSTKEEKNGVGLSLYVCKIIVELHLKGSIEVYNIDDDVVKFKLTFPKGAL